MSIRYRVSRFPVITDTRNGVAMPLADIISEIRSKAHQKAVKRAMDAYSEHGKTSHQYASIKNQLPYFTPGGVFSRRSNAGMISPSGIVQGDIDNLTGSELEYAWASLEADPHTVYLFVSPSGAGLKFGFAAPQVTTNGAYLLLFKALAKRISERYGFALDEVCKPVSHPCYLSWDPDAYYNPDADLFQPEIAQRAPTLPPAPTPRPMLNMRGNSAAAWRKLDWAMARIASAPLGERHATRLSIAQLVGGWIAANLLPASVASELAAVAAANSKNESLARRDIADGLRYGQSRPLYQDNNSLSALYRAEARGARLYNG